MKQQTKSPAGKQPLKTGDRRPQNKDDLDSREGEEQLRKGSGTTHNKKERQHQRKKVS